MHFCKADNPPVDSNLHLSLVHIPSLPHQFFRTCSAPFFKRRVWSPSVRALTLHCFWPLSTYLHWDHTYAPIGPCLTITPILKSCLHPWWDHADTPFCTQSAHPCWYPANTPVGTMSTSVVGPCLHLWWLPVSTSEGTPLLEPWQCPWWKPVYISVITLSSSLREFCRLPFWNNVMSLLTHFLRHLWKPVHARVGN